MIRLERLVELLRMKKLKIVFWLALAGLAVTGNLAQADGPNDAEPQTSGTNNTAWLSQPLSLVGAMNIALQQNAAILEAKSDLESSYGLVVVTRAVALPQLTATGQYKDTDPNSIEGFGPYSQPNQNWNAGLKLEQVIYQGGKTIAAFQAARATKQQALAQYQTALQDALLSVRVAYYDVLLASQQITVHEASVNLLQKEFEDQQHRYDAGTVPKFNVLQAEVAVANERPNLIQARNNYRIFKNNLSNLLGYNLPRDIWENIPFDLTDKLEATPYHVNLPDAIQQALNSRSELVALRKTVELEKLGIINATAGYKPTVSVFAGYTWNNAQFTPPVELDHDINGWNAGAELNWDIFDGLLTHGKVIQAKAAYEKSKTTLDDQSRQIELAVRTAYSDFIEAKEVLQSQETVQAEAEEALREAKARADAGTGTQLDVLNAETQLTQARTTQIQAMHDYETARAKLERAIGADLIAGATQ
jgi:TolC family type I secretion outer membrane protein